MPKEQAIRAQKAQLALKNAIMYYIVRMRESRKVPKLQDILENAIRQQQKQKSERRKRRQTLKIDDLAQEKSQLTEVQFESIR